MSWRDAQGRKELMKTQLVSVAPTLPVGAAFHEGAVYINPDVLVLRYNSTVTLEKHLPGCFPTQFRSLEVERIPVFVSTGLASCRRHQAYWRFHYSRFLGDLFHKFGYRYARVVFPDRSSELEPEGVLVNWDLHHAIFPPPAKGSNPYYSKKMRDLAKKRAPEHPYLAVHWQIETIQRYIRNCCAIVHALCRRPRYYAP